ncbi:GNAT family N-acetyltransferase [Cellulomonas citrea]|uniref:GNAT family N-acetyltransferase n=1 Tax=Cellulomonas citrea TaxID=1909423 RepID=UPI00135BFC7F|nr:GNAT family protein [Cellulomonas citrea]
MDKPTLTGEMLVLRPLAARDVEAILETVNDPEGQRLTGVTTIYTRREVRDWVGHVASANDRIDLAVTMPGSDDYLGEIVLDRIDRHVRSANLRLAMRPAYRGRGYGTEAIELVLGLAFDGLGLHRVGLEVLSINTRAKAIYENVGFVVEGRLRQAHLDGDRWCDAVLMGILEDEYRSGRVA